MRYLKVAFFVDPDPEAFVVPFFNISVRWYGIMFTVGFLLGYIAIERTFFRLIDSTTTLYDRDFRKKGIINAPSVKSRSDLVALFPENLISTKELASFFADRLLWVVIAGCIIGARLGHVFFYDFPYYAANPLEIFNLRAGGLASHGGTIGVLLGVYFYAVYYRKRFPELNFLRLLDFIVVPTALVAFCIRIGNFINQEILGKPTDLPWGVIFGHPAEGGALVPRHPVQLYEALFYLFTFFLLITLRSRLNPGRLTGVFFLCIFGSRFFLETFKEPQSQVFSENFLLAGQVLSIPFILIGLLLLVLPYRNQSLKA